MARLGWQARHELAGGIAELLEWAAGEKPEDRTDRANAELRARRLIATAEASAERRPRPITPP